MTEAEAALIRAIRRALERDKPPHLRMEAHTMFRVEDIYRFATDLIAEGVTVNEQAKAA